MAFYGDPDELDRLAVQIETRADEVRKHGADMDTQAGAMRWKSIAADRCRETVTADRKTLDDTAVGLDDAAAVLRAHAQQLRELLAAIKRIAESVVNWFNGAIERFNQAVESFKNAVKDIADSVGDALGFGGGDQPKAPVPPWNGWKYQPDSLPAAGDKEWLEVGKFMSAQGVA
ncbi:MAG: WXG100 family type VII secretion target [Actinomycetota bacterium]|nr:WXG100 family type VII secretion target [Actinomycetota bacterium]